MSASRNKSSAISLGALLLALVAGGCSYFSSRPDENLSGDSRSFRATASANQMPVPLPVEIADDIKKIANGEQLEPSTGWQKTRTRRMPSQAGDESAEANDGAEQEPLFTGETDSKSAPDSAPRKSSGKRSDGGASENYTVKRGDTLMKISFEKYGNVYRWREILDANKDKIRNFNALVAGTVLTINGVEYVVIDRNGKPYLIRRNDTLVKISRGLYGTPSYWKNLWYNNPQLIHNPNKIYTGFTLYYPEKPESMKTPLASSTKVASKKSRIPANAKKAKTK